MPEKHLEVIEQPLNEVIASVMNTWLQAEAGTASTSRNSVLGDWDKFHSDLLLPFSDTANQNAGKAWAHYNRLDSWTKDAQTNETLLEDETFFVRQLFCTQMFLSGARRWQCFMQSQDETDFRRFWLADEPLGADVKATVNDKQLGSTLSAQQLLAKTIQTAWLELASDYILYYASKHGSNLSAVPVWEAKSISDSPRIYHPFEIEPNVASRVSVDGEAAFDPKTWLKREVLWASLMTPYQMQADGWLDSRGPQQHNGNISREAVYSSYNDPEAASLSFFNHGKLIGGLLSSAAMFTTRIHEELHSDQTISDTVLSKQTKVIDKALKPASRATAIFATDQQVFTKCREIAETNNKSSRAEFGYSHRYLRAARLMTSLARFEIGNWLVASKRYTDEQPDLVIKNGGHPRSVGPRVDCLQPIFHKILASERYQAL